MWSSLALAIFFAGQRIYQGRSVFAALGGLGGVVFAIFVARWSGRDENFFLPGIISNQIWIIVLVVSLIFRRPLIAFGSYFLRRWPLAWYWHPQVRPAYMEVSVLWLAFLATRSVLQLSLYLNQAVDELAILSLLTGAPSTLALLAVSYIYGSWRLKHLRGPGVIEFEREESPPWRGQIRGF